MRSLIARDDIGGDDTSDAEEGSVAERGEYAGGEEEIVGRRKSTGEIAENEDAHQEKHGELAF